MSNKKLFYDQTDADIFSRGGLMLTFGLIRKKDPQLALAIRNLAGGEPLPKSANQPDNRNSDHFQIKLDSFQVRTIVEILTEQSQLETTTNPVAKSLTEDWMALAKKMISELPEDEKPK